MRPFSRAALALARLVVEPSIAATLASRTTTRLSTCDTAATRIVANHSPEPVSNITLSAVEDVVAFGGTLLAAFAPVVMLCVVVLAVIASAWLLPRMYRVARRSVTSLRDAVRG